MTIEHVPVGAPWEKSGNTSWGQCPKCKNWFHLGAEILKRPEVKLHCPHCTHEFHQSDAPRLIKAG